jgi:hypothetical protein
MVHNLVDGLPIEAILKLEELKTANDGHVFGLAHPGFQGADGGAERCDHRTHVR